jgi:hypothetical protein
MGEVNVTLRGVCCEVGYWTGAAADGGSWKQVSCVCESIVTSSGIWFYYVVSIAVFALVFEFIPFQRNTNINNKEDNS